MKKKLLSALAGTAAVLTLSAAPAEKTQTLPLAPLAVPQRWSPSESTVTLAGEKFSGQPVLKWAVKVDHFSGERNYPVGWPRMYFQTFHRKPALLSDWREWDHLEFDIRMTLADDPANKTCPLTLMIATPANRLALPLRKWHDGKLHSVKVPVDQLKMPQKITSFGFSIAESNYKHGAKLTVWAGNFRLTRSSECFVEELKLLSPAITAADNALKINLHVTGPAGNVARGVPFEVSALPSGKVLRQETLPVRRGIKDMEIEVDELRLAPGQYKLTVFPGDKAKTKSVVFTVVSSPFQVKK